MSSVSIIISLEVFGLGISGPVYCAPCTPINDVQTPCFLRVKIGAITWHTKLGLQIEGFFDVRTSRPPTLQSQF